MLNSLSFSLPELTRAHPHTQTHAHTLNKYFSIIKIQILEQSFWLYADEN